MKAKITDKQRLDFLQRLARRTEKSVGFNGLAKTVPLDSELHICGRMQGGSYYLMLRDKFGRGDFAANARSAKTVRRAIDLAMAQKEREPNP